ncbi:response regulator [Sphingomonas nostoxanthinifaciens]|uniref:response regulator n=1 Tax=Sphingomonas nostoxanthinifaciens TaxID=2872652 RepID=UPI001CC1FD76|nr:response regulator [Sphingomonas nostoxanthinifaciens]UAK26242.1 response regulator [Sphingomonas nostoxanthinifaciens]
MGRELTGKRILVVEDEYYIASDLKRLLTSADATVIGPVAALEAGLSLIECESLDAAVLDVNLEGIFSYAIADRLTERAIPYLFLTGYDDWALPAAYRPIPRVTKPFLERTMLLTVERLCAATAAA